ncbi:MAG: DUF5680 domain-containing protein, partial [Rhizobiaceae bacterium]|nr:DUF5680 domain-containing protein [Rhizobiaceae bacterium]
MVSFNNEKFLDFLLNAKRRTYAAQDSSAVQSIALVPGSKQLEWIDGDWLYRDIYFGMSRFVGQETVYWCDDPVWSMGYSGGATAQAEISDVNPVYSFLKQALNKVQRDRPDRGPETFKAGGLRYQT